MGDENDWLEGFASIPFTDKELDQIKSGELPLTGILRRRLVREVTFLRYLVRELVKQCEVLGETGAKNQLVKYAKQILTSRTDHREE